MAAIVDETGRSIPQIALNWLLGRPTVASVIIGARDEEQLRQNLGAVGWTLTDDHIARLDAASARTAPYPYFAYQRQDALRAPQSHARLADGGLPGVLADIRRR